MVVVAVATVAVNGLAAAWQLGLVADLPKLLRVRATGWKCRVSPSQCHNHFLSPDHHLTPAIAN